MPENKVACVAVVRQAHKGNDELRATVETLLTSLHFLLTPGALDCWKMERKAETENRRTGGGGVFMRPKYLPYSIDPGE